ncbi:MAG: M48 family metallopeptidase [Verrucomicrobiota bacterium]
MSKFKYFDYHERVKAVQRHAEKDLKQFFLRTYAYANLGVIATWLSLLIYAVPLAYAGYQLSVMEMPVIWGIITLILLGDFCALIHALFFASKESPAALPLNPVRYHDLYELVDEMRIELDCPRVKRICVSFEMNAAMHYKKKAFGLLGTQGHTLVLGLPLFSMLSGGQLRSVIAHELGHLKKHRKNFWVRNVAARWANVSSENATLPILVRWPLKRFAEWYLPRFCSHLSVLSRRHELEADEVAVSLTNRQLTASALRSICVASTYTETHAMDRLRQQMLKDESGPFSFYNHLLAISMEGLRSDLSELYTRKAMLEKAGPFDVHPSLSDRLEAIGTTLEEAKEQKQLKLAKSVQVYLKGGMEEYVEAYDYHSRAMLADIWNFTYQSGQIFKKELIQLKRKYQDIGFKNVYDLYKTGAIYDSLCQPGNALKFFEEAAERSPENRCLQFCLAELKLRMCERAEDITKLDHYAETMLKLVKESYRFKSQGMLQLHEYYLKAGDADRATAIFEDLLKHIDRIRDEHQERSKISGKTKMAPHGLSEDAIESMSSVFRTYPEISKTYLVQRKNTGDELEPEYILAFKLNWKHQLKPPVVELLKDDLAIRLAFYGDIHVGYMDELSWRARNKIKLMCRKPIYKRKKHT